MQYYKKLFHYTFIAIIILAFCSCSHSKKSSRQAMPSISASVIEGDESSHGRHAREEQRRQKRRLRREARNRSAQIRKTARMEKSFRKKHFNRQTNKTKEMMLNSAKESEELRNRGNFWPRLKRRISRNKPLKDGGTKWTE